MTGKGVESRGDLGLVAYSTASVVGVEVGLPMAKAVSGGGGSNCRKRSGSHFFVGTLSGAAYSGSGFRGRCRTRRQCLQSASQFFPAGSFHRMMEVRRRAVPKQFHRVSSGGELARCLFLRSPGVETCPLRNETGLITANLVCPPEQTSPVIAYGRISSPVRILGQ